MTAERASIPEQAGPDLETERLRCECGVFALYAPGLDVSRETYLALRTLQHRGHESAGIAVSRDGSIDRHSGNGLVDQVFSREVLEGLRGEMAIGHNRYSTTGASGVENEHPFRAAGPLGELALAHNGNLTNPEQLAGELADAGYPPREARTASWRHSGSLMPEGRPGKKTSGDSWKSPKVRTA